MKRSLLMIMLAVAGAGVGAGATWKLTAQEPGRPPGPPPAPPVISPAARGLQGPGVGALGRVEPQSRIRRLAAPGGMNVNRLSRLLVAEGDVVREGQLLAEFADAPLKDAEVLRAEAALTEARANLERTIAAGRPSEIAAQRARIASLTAQEENARREASRSDRLLPSGAGAEAVAERNRYAAARAAADRAEAQAALETLSSARPEDIQLGESRVASAEATLAKAIADAALSRVYAPMAGTILRILARTGDQVGNDGLLEMADLTRMDVVAEVYETDVPRLSVGLPAEILVPGETRHFTATLREIGWQIRRTTQAGTDPVAAVDARTLEVRLTLSEDARVALARRSNMQVQVAIRPPERAD